VKLNQTRIATSGGLVVELMAEKYCNNDLIQPLFA